VSTRYDIADAVDWHGCYDDGWGDFIIEGHPEIIESLFGHIPQEESAYKHPAKFAKGLIERIVLHGLSEGWWAANDLIGDPFGGVALGGLVCAYNDLRWLGVELEQAFVDLGRANIDLHRQRLTNGGLPIPKIVQGDSRRFAEIVAEAQGVVTSPPWTGNVEGHIGAHKFKDAEAFADYMLAQDAKNPAIHARSRKALIASFNRDKDKNYGTSPGQIASLPEGNADAVVTSPPYAGISPEKSGSGINIEKQWETYRASGGGLSLKGFAEQQARHSEGYGSSPGQIASLPDGNADAVVTSPPYISGGHHPDQTGSWGGQLCDHEHKGLGSKESAGYGHEDGQIGQLPPGQVDSVLTSPPWADNPEAPPLPPGRTRDTSDPRQHGAAGPQYLSGNTPGNLGNLPSGGFPLDTCGQGRTMEMDTQVPHGCTDDKNSGPTDATSAPADLGIPSAGAALVSEDTRCNDTAKTVGSRSGAMQNPSAAARAQASVPTEPGKSDQSGGAEASPSSLAPTTTAGAAAAKNGVGRDGSRNAAKPSSATETDVSGVGTLSDCGSTTSKTQKKPVANGITPSPTSKRSASRAISRNTLGSDAMCADATPVELPSSPRRTMPSSAAVRVAGKVTKRSDADLREGQLDGAVTSPPYEGTVIAGGNHPTEVARIKRKVAAGEMSEASMRKTFTPASQQAIDDYGDSYGQIGKEQGETYWSAMRLVYDQCLLSLKPGGVMAVVVKSYVKKGELVDLPSQTWKLLLHLGFEPVQRIRAWLVKEHKTTGLFGQEEVERKERKGFFRRLAEKKGAPPIDWEEVLVVRKSLTDGPGKAIKDDLPLLKELEK